MLLCRGCTGSSDVERGEAITGFDAYKDAFLHDKLTAIPFVRPIVSLSRKE